MQVVLDFFRDIMLFLLERAGFSDFGPFFAVFGPCE